MRQTIALIPGSFRPPHKGHWDMIGYYSNLADYVIVFISDPNIHFREFRLTGRDMPAKDAKSILDIFKSRFGTTNVKIVISDEPSPAKAVMHTLQDITGCTVMIGQSDKGNDNGRFGWIVDQCKNRNDLTVIPPEKTVYRANKEQISSSDIRNSITSFDDYVKYLPSGLTSADFKRINRICGF